MGKSTYFMDIVINKERLSNGKPVFVARCPSLGIASQGMTIEESRTHIKEAIELYLEEQPEKYNEFAAEEAPLFSVVEVTKLAQVAHSVR